MKELGITEDMIYGDLITGKSDCYEKSSGKKLWMGRYQGGRKKIAARERESSSSSHYDKEPSRSLSSPGYKTHVVSHVDIASSSAGGTSLPRFSTETENNESQEYPSSNMYVMKSGDTQERPSSQASDNNSQGMEREGSASVSLSQASQVTKDSVHNNGKKRQLTSGDSCINSQLHARKQYESESDDSVFKEKGKLKNYSLKRKRQSVDRRSRGSPKKRANDYSDDEKPKQDQKYPSRSDSVSLCQSPLQAEANIKVSAAAQVDEMVNQIHSVDLENFSEVPGPELVKQEPSHRIDLDYDQLESQVSAQLDTHQTEPEIQSSCTSMSCTPPISAFDFERDETPPAEIVEATAEWCRTQNFPADFSSVSLQHVFQYYQSSMAVDGTKNKNEGRLWHSPIWQGIFQQRDQPLGQSLAATSSDVTNPACSSQSAFYASLQNVSPTAECSSSASDIHVHAHFSARSKPVTKGSKQANLATVQQHGVPICSYLACEPWSSHLNNAMDEDTCQLSDGEIQEHLKMFLNKQEAETIEHSFDCEHMPACFVAGVETTSDVTGCTGLEQANHTVRHCSQQGEEASSNFDLISPCHSRDQNIFTTPEHQERSYLMSNTDHSCMQQGRNQRLTQHLSSQSYPLNEHVHVHKGSRDYEQALTHDRLSTLNYGATMNSVEETTARMAEKDYHHKYDQKVNEPSVSRNQWKEGEYNLSGSQQYTGKGLWRTEELEYVQEPLRRGQTDNLVGTAPCIVHTVRPPDSSLATRGEVHNGDNSNYTFSSRISLDSVYQSSSVTASQACNEMSCIHEGVVQGSQLRHLNEPTAREPYQYSPSRDHRKQASQVDLAPSPFSGYQRADVDELRVSSPDFLRRQQQRVNTERGHILPNRSMSRLKSKSMYTPLQELSKLDINPVSRGEDDPDRHDLCVPQVLNDPNKDQPRRLLHEELATTDIDVDDDAEEVSSKKLVLDKHKPTCTEPNLGMGSDDTEVDAQISGADVQVLQSKKQKLVADKYKHLQKYYYKVNTC